jgi:Domain of unknown function (DUF362)/TAT (twin-arginine translocation) pathway signal sequence
MTHLTRRQFLKLTGAAAGAVLLAPACTAKPTMSPATPIPTAEPTSMPSPTPAPIDTAAPAPSPTPAPTNTPAPTAAPTGTVAPAAPAASRADIVKIYPDVPSRVVRVRHAGVWKESADGGVKDNDRLSPETIRQMLDAAIVKLTGLGDAQAAWATLFAPQERIAIKVNTVLGGRLWTHVPLALAVAECLQDAGVPPEQVIIFDRYNVELMGAGYTINRGGPGVRCTGTDFKYTGGWKLMDEDIKFSDVLLNSDALINIPVLKDHAMAGITFALKNHYGTFDSPEKYHDARTRQALAELNALPPIKERARLIVGDVLAVASGTWRSVMGGDSILMSFDPVAHDAFGLQLYSDLMAAKGSNSTAALKLAAPWLKNAAALGLGTHDPAHIELMEVNLG